MAIQNQYSWGAGTPYTAEEFAGWIPYKLDPATLILVNEDPYKVTYSTQTISNDMPEYWEFGATPFNVYNNTAISKMNQANSAMGRQLLIKHTAMKRQFDSTDYNYYKLAPLTSWTVIKAPINEIVTVTDIQNELRRMAGGYIQAAANTAVIEKMMLGGLRMV